MTLVEIVCVVIAIVWTCWKAPKNVWSFSKAAGPTLWWCAKRPFVWIRGAWRGIRVALRWIRQAASTLRGQPEEI